MPKIGNMTVDFSGEITFTKNEYGYYMEKDGTLRGVTFKNQLMYTLTQKTKLGRFLYACKKLWRYC